MQDPADIVGEPMPDAGADRAVDAGPLPAAAIPGEVPAEDIGRRDGPDPTRYGDWERNGRCIDF